MVLNALAALQRKRIGGAPTRPDPGDYGTCVQALWGDDAPSGSVGTWPFDTYGSNATQATGSKQPTLVANDLNGHDTLSFDGDDWMSFTTVSGASVFIVFNHNDGDQDYAALLGNSATAPLHGGAGTAMFNSGFFVPSDFASGALFDDGSSVAVNSMTKPTTFHLMSFITGSAGVNFDTIATNAGWEVSNPTRVWNGKIAAIIIFSDILNTTNRQNLESALGAYFGI